MRSTFEGPAAALLLVLLGAGGCADPASVTTTAPPTVRATTPSTAPTTAAPGACAWQSRTDEAEPESGTVTGGEAADNPPNHADNRRWRQREGVSPEEARVLARLVPETRTILTESCRRGDFSPVRIQQELQAIAPPEGTAWATQRLSASGIPSTAVDGYVQVGNTCLVIALEPAQITIESTTVIADGGCWEPLAH